MESNLLKQKPFSLQPSHFQSNKTAPSSLNMGGESNAGVKTNKHTRGDKENSDPNRRTLVKSLGDPNVRTMKHTDTVINHDVDKHGGHKEIDTHVAAAIKELHVHEKSSTSSESASHNPSKHSTAIPQAYVDAIKQLNTLQSNVKALKEARAARDPAETKFFQVDQVLHYLSLLNVTADDISKLHFIHISGTKGKGSTSAYCESILRAHGFSTGFFSSPHLIEVRERIKLNGQPVSYDLFTRYFWTVYKALHASRAHPDDMPGYFKFLSVMSFYMFVKERPDVCIMEVGIGGLYDNTNIIPNTDVVGITSLGLDHTAVLGDTMEAIAHQKAGIMKPGCFAVTAAQQKDKCKRVLLDRSRQTECYLLEAPGILQYDWRGQALDEDWKSTVQSINISLAIQLAYLWMFRMNKAGEWKTAIEKFLAGVSSQQRRFIQCESNANRADQKRRDPNHVETLGQTNVSLPVGLTFEIDPCTYRGIRDCVWPGRVQVIRKSNMKYFLDGAHTSDSIDLCSQWFRRKSEEEISRNERTESNRLADSQLKGSDHLKQSSLSDTTSIHHKESLSQNRTVHRILVFNVTGDRDPASLLPPLIQHNRFDYILVTPILLTNDKSPDIQYGGPRTNPINSNFAGMCHRSTVTDRIRPSSLNTVDSTNNTLSCADKLTGVQKIASVASALSAHARTQVVVLDNVLDTYNFRRRLDPSKEYHVLVTGSLHLVGAFLNVLTNYE